MFKILGSDGKEYGPVTDGQLRQWIAEGRAGGQTRVKPEGAVEWVLLNTLPAFADLFRTPTPVFSGPGASMPPVVRIVAIGFFVIAAVSGLRLAASLIQMVQYSGSKIYSPRTIYFLWFLLGIVSLPLRVVCGVGLLRGKHWAWAWAVGFVLVLTIFGAWGLVSAVVQVGRIMSNDPQFIFRSPLFLVVQLWSVVVFAFNIFTIFALTRKPLRDAFARGVSPAL